MKHLNANWLTEGLIDFEYKKYVLLAYLKHIQKCFKSKKLYPFLSDLFEHYNNLLAIKTNKDTTSDGFPSKINKLNFNELTIEYEELLKDSTHIKIIERIIDYALPSMKKFIINGQEMYDWVEQHLSISCIGILPIYTNDGYMLLKQKNSSTSVYEYNITIYNRSNESFKAVKTKYLTSYKKSLNNTFENIKADLIKNNKDLPNPATYLFETELNIPYKETFLPIAKRSLANIVDKKMPKKN